MQKKKRLYFFYDFVNIREWHDMSSNVKQRNKHLDLIYGPVLASRFLTLFRLPRGGRGRGTLSDRKWTAQMQPSQTMWTPCMIAACCLYVSGWVKNYFDLCLWTSGEVDVRIPSLHLYLANGVVSQIAAWGYVDKQCHPCFLHQWSHVSKCYHWVHVNITLTKISLFMCIV